MVRSTFSAAVMDYLTAMRPYRMGSTLERLRRDLRTIHADLKAVGIEKSPSAFTEADIEALLFRWQNRPTRRGTPMDLTSQAHLFRALKGFLEWSGNTVVTRMKARGHVRFPKTLEKPIQVLGEQELTRIRVAAETIEGWPGTVARFLVVFLPATALRPNEMRLARFRDLDLDRGRILVAHPKGERSWAAPDYAPVLSIARSGIEDYLRDREAFLGSTECEWLLPYSNGSGEIGPWSEPMLRKLKAEIARRSGVPFSLKTFRATFAQLAKDGGASIEAVSKALRHKSTRTTEAYYARIRPDDAFREVERAFAGLRIRAESGL